VKRLAEIENIVGIKEASGNVSQMASILNAVRTTSSSSPRRRPSRSLSSRSVAAVISVVSNEIPAEMSQLTRLASRATFLARARFTAAIIRFMEINFVESNSIPVRPRWRKWACSNRYGACHLCRPRRRIRRASEPCSKRSGSSARGDRARVERVHAASQLSVCLTKLQLNYEELHFGSSRFQSRAEPRRNSRCRTRCVYEIRLAREPWVKKGILLGFRMGAIADMSIDSAKQPFFDKSTYPVRAFTSSDGVRIVPGGSSIRDGSYIAAASSVAADVRQRRRLRW